jgi:hypothetical protein
MTQAAVQGQGDLAAKHAQTHRQVKHLADIAAETITDLSACAKINRLKVFFMFADETFCRRKKLPSCPR